MVHTAPHIAPARDDVGRRAPPVRRTQHGRAASPMLAQPHRVAASTLCCIAMRACSGLIMRLGAGSHVALAQPHWRPVPCTHADRAGSTRVRRKAADGAPHLHHRDLRQVRAAVSEWALSRTSTALASCFPVCFPCTHCARYAQVGDRAGSAVASAARASRPLAHREHREHVSHVRPRAPTHTALWPCSPAPRR